MMCIPGTPSFLVYVEKIRESEDEATSYIYMSVHMNREVLNHLDLN